MSRGSVKYDLQSVSAGGFLTILPPSGEEWVLHTIYSEYPSELYFTDGTDLILAESLVGVGGYVSGLTYRLTHNLYFKLKNVDSASRKLAYSGIQTADSSTPRVGSTVSDFLVLTEGDSLIIGPDAGYEYEVQNIFFSDSVDISLDDGMTTLMIARTATSGVWRNTGFELVHDNFKMQINNPNPSDVIVGYTGIITRIP